MKETNSLLKVNKLQNRYVTDGNIWTVDETFFSKEIFLFLVINLKTRAILGYILGHKTVTSYYIVELYKNILSNYKIDQKPHFVHSNLNDEYYKKPEIEKFFKEEQIKVSLAFGDKHQNQVSESVNDKIKYQVILKLISKNT